MTDSSWEQDTLRELFLENINEQKRSRWWKNFFRAIFLFLIVFFIYLSWTTQKNTSVTVSKSHVALIDVRGPIFDTAQANADNVASALHRAYKDKGTKGIIIRINSPGGSPVQSSYIYNEIQRLKERNKDIKIYAVCVDICASGAYYIAAAADEIYASPLSLIGSIGVLFNGFGFENAMEKLGIERRLVTAGANKAFMDPFSPWKPESKNALKKMLNDIHQNFISDVKKGRNGKLKQDPTIFSGLIWTGDESKSLGLVDGFGSAGFVAREVIKEENLVNYTVKPKYFERLAERFGMAFGAKTMELLNGKIQ